MATRQDVESALRHRLLSGSYLGLISPGGRLPSVRDLALEFGVGTRVIPAAYRTLEREGLVELKPRSGIFCGAIHAPVSESVSGTVA